MEVRVDDASEAMVCLGFGREICCWQPNEVLENSRDKLRDVEAQRAHCRYRQSVFYERYEMKNRQNTVTELQ